MLQVDDQKVIDEYNAVARDFFDIKLLLRQQQSFLKQLKSSKSENLTITTYPGYMTNLEIIVKDYLGHADDDNTRACCSYNHFIQQLLPSLPKGVSFQKNDYLQEYIFTFSSIESLFDFTKAIELEIEDKNKKFVVLNEKEYRLRVNLNIHKHIDYVMDNYCNTTKDNEFILKRISVDFDKILEYRDFCISEEEREVIYEIISDIEFYDDRLIFDINDTYRFYVFVAELLEITRRTENKDQE